MGFGSYLRFHQTIDIYWKTAENNAAGQRVHSFNYRDTIPVFAQWSNSQNLNNPYIANYEELDLFIPKDYINFFDYNCRFKNLKDRYGNSIDDAFFDVISIEKRMQFSGKVHHLLVRLRRVVEKGD
jgi:hypothetical protein